MGTTSDRMIDGGRELQAWTVRRPMAADVALAGLVACLGLAGLTGDSLNVAISRDPDLVGVLLILAGAFALIWRRTAPIRVLFFAISVLVIIYVREYGTYGSAIGITAIYSVAAHSNNRRRAWEAILLGTGVLFAVASLTVLHGAGGYSIDNALSMLLSIACAAAGGGIVRNRHEIFVSTEARADRAEADRLIEAERAVARERLRIAREMHDVVAHSMSAVAVQAAAAQEITHTQPDRAIAAMQKVEATSREALTEMRRMLGVLRNGDDTSLGLNPQPTLADLTTLIEQSTASGVATEFEITGRRRALPPGIELAAFRIVQESLTNVRKHGGTASALVRVDYGVAALTIEVVDDGAGTAASLGQAGGGNGLIGMRERVDAYNGEFSAGPRTGGGYTVRARLPLAGEPSQTSSNSAEARHAEPNRR